MQKLRTIVSSDNVEYSLNVIEDVVALNKGQIELLEEQIQKMTSLEVESEKGVPIHAVTDEQSAQVIRFIEEILGNLSVPEIIEQELIDKTRHAIERASNDKLCIERNWNPENIEYEIVESIKRAHRVNQIRVRFDTKTKENWPQFGFKLTGFKNGKDNDDAQLVIYFEKDPEDMSDVIMVVTILTCD